MCALFKLRRAALGDDLKGGHAAGEEGAVWPAFSCVSTSLRAGVVLLFVGCRVSVSCHSLQGSIRRLAKCFHGFSSVRIQIFCSCAAAGEHRGSKVADVYPGVTDVYRNGLLHMFLVGRRSHTCVLL